MKEFVVLVCFVLKAFGVELHHVRTPSGEIKGFIDNVEFDGVKFSVRKYLGIPYAEAPVGNLRFQKPIQKKLFKPAYDATELKPVCVQAEVETLPRKDFQESEDCLFLNVYVPKLRKGSTSGKSVIVYLHGGFGKHCFVNGGSNFVSGDVLSAIGDVIVVTFNYRLSLLGFFSAEDGMITGNFGLWDQQLAISWVHRNIKAFGGDPRKVTLFGEDQGAVSAILQSFYPGNVGMFQRVIAHKGTPLPTMSDGLSAYITPTYPVMRTFENLGCVHDNFSVMVNCVLNVSSSSIKEFVESENDNEAFTPSIDGLFILADAEFMVSYEETSGGFSGKDILIGFEIFDKKYRYLSRDMDNNSIAYYEVKKKSKFELFIHDIILQIYGYDLPKLTEDVISNRYMDLTDAAISEQTSMAKFVSDTSVLIPSIRTYQSHRQFEVPSKSYLYEIHSKPSVSSDSNRLDEETSEFSVHESFYMFGFSKEMLAAHNISHFKPNKGDIQNSEEVVKFISSFAKKGKPIWKGKDLSLDRHDSDTNSIPCVQLPSGEIKDYKNNPSVTFWLDIVPRLINQSKPITNMDYGAPIFNPPDNDEDDHQKDISKEGANAVIIALGVITGLLCLCLIGMAIFGVYMKIRRLRIENQEYK